MSRRIAQPINQVRLTNVAVVRLQKAGKRFEIACYRNKVVNWRNKVETDIDEVLQIDQVFQNVSKGVLAKHKDLQKAFGTTETEECCRIILEKGELQVSDKEREAHQENLLRDIATIVSEKCVNPDSNRPYTVNMILNAMKEIHFSVIPNRSAKQQALELIRKLKEVMPIERAKMHLRIIIPSKDWVRIKPKVQALSALFQGNEQFVAANVTVEFFLDPGHFRTVSEAVREEARGQGRVEVVQLSVQQEGEADMDMEIALREHRSQQQKQQEQDVPLKAEESQSAENSEESPAPNTTTQELEEPNENGSKGKKKKKSQRKSKGAKRREREEKEEKEAKIQEALARQAARQLQVADSTQEPVSGGTVLDPSTLPPAPPGPQQEERSCNTCGGSFATPAAHRAHFRSDWHRYNLKLKMKGGTPVSEEEFMSFDAEEMFMINDT
mmetsp:Transcript_5079/g.7013  ORF Transcript_5079/g.7013 Transcript_5079/m.7013 type:complete len:441 (+) Transcript_5079:117-1439(+)|eukprot:CAMPEP_0117802732 /NCGR_PEP_ID=MMETSP0948-20121206/15935_1 /TAXON_ID=44440 /ORGANISM="Chattonella subsalsa, Strain CCMP2191" /LENGTH=440 /DNA_ID=CAMNT_0005635647 /DNA_START=16 /DNA_END=1338 /DNA_ORIENTATION=+